MTIFHFTSHCKIVCECVCAKLVITRHVDNQSANIPAKQFWTGIPKITLSISNTLSLSEYTWDFLHNCIVEPWCSMDSNFHLDLRGDRSIPASRCVSFDEGKKMAAATKCCRYLETSALHQDGLTGMFELAARVGLAAGKSQSKKKGGGFFAVKRKTASGPPEIILPPVMPPTGESLIISHHNLDLNV